ncbi:MMPL family transporter [Vibrio sp. 99-70-13A1]|uniref:MMPL family transporter n=1 Tax=Vibrio sp. 99-70-13A1 TaxID=2607601 RepID=UPI0014939FC8|nr:MMPL family transporter [Vibrio sp. 99-70-13A1]NOH98786.1 MMPL family transporter [Vibrio sp. 99-70-13A1]
MPNRNNLSSKLALLWLIVVVFFGGLLIKQFAFSPSVPIETNILRLLPQNQQDPIAEQAFQQISSSMSNQVVFMISGASEETTIAAVKQFERNLHQLNHRIKKPLFEDIQGKISQQTQAKWADFYFQHRSQLLTPSQQKMLEQSPSQQTQYVIQSLYNPFSGVTATELASDPFLLFRDYLSEVGSQSSNFTFKNGYLTVNKDDQFYILVTATLKQSPYSLQTQSHLPELIELEKQVEGQFDVDILHTGVVFYADYGTQSAKSEISTIGIGSLIGVILLVWFTFRSALPLGLALLSISTGLLVALASTVAIFGQVHLFSLVFGASLIGVSIDYAFHYLTDRLAAGSSWNSQRGLKHILIAITLGLATSLIGYLGLLAAPFPGLQQLALFSSIGLIAAYVSVVCWYPVLAEKPSADTPLPLTKIWAMWFSLWDKPKFKVILPSALFVLSLVTLTQISYNDDIRQLQAMPDSLKHQEELIASLSGVSQSQDMLLITEENAQLLLSKISHVSKELDALIEQEVISGYQSIHQYLPTIEEQKQNHQLVQQLYLSQQASLQSTLGWKQFPEITPFNPFNAQDFLDSPVSKPVKSLWLNPIDDLSASIVLIQNIRNPKAFTSWLASKKTHQDSEDSQIRYLNKANEISDLFTQYRTKITELLIIALVVILAVLSVRYGFRQSVLMVIPSLIAGVAGLAITALLGSSLNLFNLLGLILILGIGIDYTLFFAEQKKSQSTLLAITLSCLTTLLSFGLLSLSNTHAIHSFGITVLTGIFVAWLLSPMALRRPRPSV